MKQKRIHCNNGNCQDRELCKFGGMWHYSCAIIYGQGMNSNECPDYQPRYMDTEQLISNDGNNFDTP